MSNKISYLKEISEIETKVDYSKNQSVAGIINIESLLLGSMAKNFHFFLTGCEKLNKSHFVDPKNIELFSILKDMYSERIGRINTDMIIAYMGKTKHVTEGYILNITKNACSFNFTAYISIVEKLRSERQLRKILKESNALIGKSSPVDIANILMKNISNEMQNSKSSIKDSSSLFSVQSGKVINSIKQIYEDPQILNKKRVLTGFHDIDNIIGGFERSHFVILAARPSMGKTALALNFALKISERNIPVGILSMEMSAEQLGYRLISSASEIDSSKISQGKLTIEEFDAITNASAKLSKLPLYIEDSSDLSIVKLQATIRKLKHLYKIEVLIIDYLQLLSGKNSSSQENRQQEIASISRAIKLMCQELDICIVCLSQLSRKVEERPDKRPKMSDLRESGSIEQDADQVMLLYRADYYISNDDTSADIPSTPMLYIVKNRHGSIGNARLSFRPNIVKFSSYEETPLSPDCEYDF